MGHELNWAISLPLILFVASGCATTPKSAGDDSFQRKYGDYTYCAVETVRQADKTDCGPACLLAVTRYWQAAVPRPEIEQSKLPHSPNGYTLRALKDASVDHGLRAYIIAMRERSRAQLEEQIRKGRPVICAVQQPRRIGPARYIPLLGQAAQAAVTRFGPSTNHFVVVMGISRRRVLLMDPAVGFDAMRWRTFERRWSQMDCATLLLSA
jgi:predicted double-glycine peptidase